MTTSAQDPAASGTPFNCAVDGCRGCDLGSRDPDCTLPVDHLAAAREYDSWLAGRGLRARHMRFLMSAPGAFLANTPVFLLPEVLGLQPHHRLLDLGCGRGAVSRLLAARAGLQTPPVGLEISRVMLHLARRDQRHDGPSAARLTRGTVTSLPFQDGSFDAAVAAHVIKHLPDDDLHAFLREASRVLRPGGRLVLWDFARTGSPLADRVHRRVLGDRIHYMRLRSFGDISAVAVTTGWSRISLLRRQPFLYPPIPRVAVLFEK